MPGVWDSLRRSRRTHSALRCAASAIAALVTTGAIGCASANASREPMVTDRPDFTESTSTMAPGNVQAEGGYTFSRAASEETSTIGELLVRVGVTHRAELRIEPGSLSRVTSPTGTETGREDAELGAKVRLHAVPDDQPSPVPAVSLVVASSVPTGSAAFRENRLQPEVKLATEWTLTHRLGLAANVDVARPVADVGRYTELAASASFGVDLSPRFGAFAELFGFAPEFDGAKRTCYVDTGLTASLRPNLQVDVRGGLGLNGVTRDYFLGAGLAHRW